MKFHLSALNVEGLEDVQLHVMTFEHPGHRNPVGNEDSKYQIIRIARGKLAILLCFDHPENVGASVFNGLEDIRTELLAHFPTWKDDVLYVGQPDGARYVYTLVDFDKNGWLSFHDRIPTSSLAHQYGIPFEPLRQLVLDVQSEARATQDSLSLSEPVDANA